MKKISFALFMLLGLTVVSCDMDKEPYGSLVEENALQSMNDVHRFRNSLYSNLRSMTLGSWLVTSDIQMDEFHGVINNGNRYGIISNGIFTSSSDEVTGFWGGCYGVIASANYLINKIEDLKTNEEFEGEDNQTELARYQAEAYFVRAFAYFFLVDHYCLPYNKENGSTPHLGLPIVTKYNPTGDISVYPDRSTLDETYALIESDLEKAYDGLKAYEEGDDTELAPMAAYLSSYTVEAMQARVALVKGDFDTAYEKSTDVINSGIYELADIDNYADMWTEDNSKEILFRPFQSNTELSSATGANFLNRDEKHADYIPTFDILASYVEDDCRFDAFFTNWSLDIEGSDYRAWVFCKYPGNVALRTSQDNNFANMGKPFRLAEQYLIAAEAAACKTNPDIAAGGQYLITLQMHRIDEFDVNGGNGGYNNATTLMNDIKAERLKELIGEGFRMSDLRRWHQGFSRNPNHAENASLNSVIVAAGAALTYEADDYRFTWPIPKDELDANPNIKDQQNPGY